MADEAMRHREKMLAMIRQVLAGEMEVKDFTDKYWNYYLREVPSGLLPEREEEFFGAVQERLDFTDEEPDDEERGEQGWMDFDELKEWLGDRLAEFESGKPLDLEWF